MTGLLLVLLVGLPASSAEVRARVAPVSTPRALTAPLVPLPVSPALAARIGAAQSAREAGASAPAGVHEALVRLGDGIAADKTPGGQGALAASQEAFDGLTARRDGQAVNLVADAAEISREITEPPRVLLERGVQGTIPVYGSARIPSPEAAAALYRKAVETHGRKPKSAAGRSELKAAKQAVRNSRYYELARRFGELVARGGGGKIAVVTGGGPGIMEAANRGAFEAGGPSVGYNILLPHEQHANPYITPGLGFDFEHFASRKMNLRRGAVAMVYFPGGFGTMDELFEVLTLMQTGKIPRRPIVLMGEKEYWHEVLDFRSFSRMGLISPEDLGLFRFAETAEQAWGIVRAQR